MSHGSADRLPRPAAVVVAVVSAALLGTGAVLAGHAANAALIDVPVTGVPGRLVLAADRG